MKELSPELITIIPSPDIDPELIVDIADFEEYFITPEVTAVQEIACIRQSPYVTPDNELVVNILVNKGEMGKFAKIEEKIPPGYTAVNTKARGAIFTFKDQTVKYLWMNLPEESNYIISYILIPDQGGTPGTVNIDGYFSYFEDDETQSVNIIEKETDLLSITDEELSTLLATIPVREVEIQTVIAGQETTEEIVTTTVTEAEDQAVVTEPAKYPVTEEELEELYTDKSYILVSGSGVYYRVQIAAGHDLIDIKKYFAKYNITEEIKIEKHDSWRKYSVGSYSTYREARDSRINIWNTTTIDDAFVVAYNNGVRITVQEALMIANQKWYQ